MTVYSKETLFGGLLASLKTGQLQARGLLDIVPLFPDQNGQYEQYISPLQSLKIVQVPTYGTLVLHNTAQSGITIAPMHVGFFQVGAQNHATSRVVILGAGETLKVTDCFCIQASQGGLLKEAQQRFIILPLSLRRAALEKRGTEDFSRLWEDIESHNRRYGIARGGHLERFLRPYFPRLLPFRHAFEALPQQVGAAYFVAGRLVGVEVTPNPGYWQDVGPILNIYCYGSAALLAERHNLRPARKPLDVENLADLHDLDLRLTNARQQEEAARVGLIAELSAQSWDYSINGEAQGLRIVDLQQGEWVGQMVKNDTGMVYLSVFRDVV